MKYSKLTYYLLTILCFICVSCSNDGLTDDVENGNQETAESVRVQLRIDFPVSTRATTATDDGTTSDGEQYERYINDVRIFAFVKEGEWGAFNFIEEARNVIIDSNDGSVNRVVHATLTKSKYTSGQVSLVTIINSRARGINDIELDSWSGKNALYNQLMFNYDKSNQLWEFKGYKQYIPMWGETIITNINNTNIESLQLKRAIAKVGITINNGNGLAGFQINKVSLYNYNDKGYCTPVDKHENALHIPIDVTQVTDSPIVVDNLSDEEGRKSITDRIYIPEHNNVNADNSQGKSKKLYIVIETTVNGKPKTYTLNFVKKKEDGSFKDYDIFRNNSYIFNINSVKSDEPDATVDLNYEVIAWGDIEIDVPAFGEE